MAIPVRTVKRDGSALQSEKLSGLFRPLCCWPGVSDGSVLVHTSLALSLATLKAMQTFPVSARLPEQGGYF